MENNHGTAYKRHKGFVHQKRKEKIIKEVYKDNDNKTLEKPHKLNKGKAHCSCVNCQCKAKNSGMKHSDRVNMSKGQDQETYYEEEDGYVLKTPNGTMTYTTTFAKEEAN